MKEEYSQVQSAMEAVRGCGYGVVDSEARRDSDGGTICD